MFDSVLKNLTNALTWVLNLLPNSPFQQISNSDVSQYISTMNWFIPVSQIVAELEVWLVCVLVFYAYQLILRWIRAIE